MNNIRSQLNEFCAEISTDRTYVQGAGGNVSFKKDKYIFVKASGTRLSDALKTDLFVKLNLDDLNKQFNKNNFVIDNVVKKNKLRPSIETVFHAILTHKVVVHLHAIDALSILIKKSCEKTIKKIIKDELTYLFIDYVKPGTQLGLEIYKKDIDAKKPIIIFLKNHGIIIASDTVDSIRSNFLKLKNLLSKDKKIVRKLNNEISVKSLKKFKIFNTYYVPFKKKDIHNLALNNYLSQFVKNKWALYPDHIVFLGHKAFFYNDRKEFESKIKNDNHPNVIFIKNEGVYAKNKVLISTEEQLLCYYDLVKQLDYDCDLNLLNDDEINELINWDAEKYRIKKAI